MNKINKSLSLESLPNEEWRDIPGYENLYQMSSFLRIKRLMRECPIGQFLSEKIIKCSEEPKDYFYTRLSKEKKRTHHSIAELFYLTFPELNKIKDLPGEIWKEITEFKGYFISNKGRAKSLPKLGQPIEILLKPSYGGRKYPRVCLCNENGQKTIKISRLVGKAFLENPNNHPNINHINDNKDDNDVENLYWGTCKQNTDDAIRNGVRNIPIVGEKHYLTHLTNEQVMEIRNLHKFQNISYTKLGEQFCVNKQTISDIVKNKTWKHLIT